MNRIKCFLICIMLITLAAAVFGEDKPDALALFLEGKYTESEKVCLAEIEETPKNMESYVVLGWAFLAQKKYREAAEYAEAAMRVSRYDLRNIFTAAEAYYYIGDNINALKYLEEYAQLAPTGKNTKLIYYYMGEIYIRLGEYITADIAISTALHYDNSMAEWWARLGYAREMGRDYPNALEAYNNALRLDPDNMDAKRGKTKIEQLLG